MTTSTVSAIPTPAELADQLTTVLHFFWETVGELHPDEIETAQVMPGWTTKALAAHLAFWDDYQLRRMQAALDGSSRGHGFPRPDLDNDARAALDNARDWDEIVADVTAARQRLADFARNLPPAVLAQEFMEGDRPFSILGQLRHMVRHVQVHRRDLQDYTGSLVRWGVTGLRELVDRQYRDFMDGVAGLDEATMLTVQVCGHWTVRDVMAHVLGWNELAEQVVRQWPDPDPSTVSAWKWQPGDNWATLNERLLRRQDGRTVIELADGLVTCHRRFLAALDRGAATLQTPGYGWGDGRMTLACFLYEVHLHMAEHAAQFWAYRAGLRDQEAAFDRSDDS